MPPDPPAAALATYARRIGLFSATMLVVGGIIGSGIFLNPSIVARRTGSSLTPRPDSGGVAHA